MGTFDFMRARLIRLYPLYFLGSLLGIAVTLASLHGRNISNWDTSSLAQAALLAILFLPNFSTRPLNAMFPLNIPCWSLFLEIVVNLLFVMFWPLLTSRRLITLSLLTGGILGWAIEHMGSIDQGAVGSSIAVGLARAVFGFSVGVLIARHVRLVHRRQSNLGVLAIVAVVGIAISGWPEGGLRAIWDAVCVLVVFPLIVCLSTVMDPGSLLRRLATFLGVTSYAIYVLHTPLLAVLNSAIRVYGSATGGSAGAFYVVATVVAVLLMGCWLVDRYYDLPIRAQLGLIVPKMRKLRAH